MPYSYSNSIGTDCQVEGVLVVEGSLILPCLHIGFRVQGHRAPWPSAGTGNHGRHRRLSAQSRRRRHEMDLRRVAQAQVQQIPVNRSRFVLAHVCVFDLDPQRPL